MHKTRQNEHPFKGGERIAQTPLRVCSQSGRTNPHHSHGLCAPHARKRLRRLKKCAEPGCSAEAIKLGYCWRHEGRLLEQLRRQSWTPFSMMRLRT